MKSFILGIIVGAVLMGTFAIAQNQDFYGRPQFGKKVYPPADAFGRPNPPEETYLKKHKNDPC